MIIREQGTVVGLIDDKTLALTDVTSDRLRALINDWKANGFNMLGGAPVSDNKLVGDVEINVAYKDMGAGMIENKLLVAGFDVQTA